MWNHSSAGKVKKPKTVDNICGNSRVKEYNDNTSLHGPKYITESERHPVERMCWLIIVIAAICGGVYLTMRIVTKWKTSPIITSIDTTSYPVNRVPFPAVTICPVYKGMKEKLITEACKRKLPSKLRQGDDLGQVLQKAIGPLLNIKFPPTDSKTVFNATYGNETFNKEEEYYEDVFSLNTTETVSLLKKISPRCKDYILKCSWDGRQVNCTQLFDIYSTDDGFCCSFNLVPPKETLSDVGTAEESAVNDVSDMYYDNDDQMNYEDYEEDIQDTDDVVPLCPSTPLEKNNWQDTCDKMDENAKKKTGNNKKVDNTTRARTVPFALRNSTGPGQSRGLTVLVDPLACGWLPTASFVGLKVYVHNPSAFPEVGQRGMSLGSGTENFIDVRALFTDTTQVSRFYSNTTRGCNFPNEKKLSFYNSYSRSNCEMEQRILTFKEFCGCKPYYYPGNSPLCNSTGMECVMGLNEYANDSQCLPSCSEVTYDTTISSVKFPGQSVKHTTVLQDLGKNYTDMYLSSSMTLIHVFFRESSIVKYKRDELYAIEDVISNIGGSLGLCMGFSLVSAFELIYFFTIRCIMDRKNHRKP